MNTFAYPFIIIIILCLRLIADSGQAMSVAHNDGGIIGVGVAQWLARPIEDCARTAVVGNLHQEATLAWVASIGLHGTNINKVLSSEMDLAESDVIY